MTLYADSSALFKLYVVEPGSEEVRRLVSGASTVLTSAVAFVEIRAALARLQQVLERTDDDIEFSSFDDRLSRAAKRLR